MADKVGSCPLCGGIEHTLNTRLNLTTQRRRRRLKCLSCDNRRTTVEIDYDEYKALAAYKNVVSEFAKGLSNAVNKKLQAKIKWLEVPL